MQPHRVLEGGTIKQWKSDLALNATRATTVQIQVGRHSVHCN
jgi:hypothetical protein